MQGKIAFEEHFAIEETLGLRGRGSYARATYLYSRLGRVEDAARLFEALQQLSVCAGHFTENFGKLWISHTVLCNLEEFVEPFQGLL